MSNVVYSSSSGGSDDLSFGHEESEYNGVKQMPVGSDVRAQGAAPSIDSNRRDGGGGAAVIVSQPSQITPSIFATKQFVKGSAFEFSHNTVRSEHKRSQSPIDATLPQVEIDISPTRPEDQNEGALTEKTPSRKFFGISSKQHNRHRSNPDRIDPGSPNPKFGRETTVRKLFTIGNSHPGKKLADYKEREESMKHALNDALARCVKSDLISSRSVNEVSQLRITIAGMEEANQHLTQKLAVQSAELSAASTTVLKMEDAVLVARSAADQHATATEHALTMGNSITCTMAGLEAAHAETRSELKAATDEIALHHNSSATLKLTCDALRDDLKTSKSTNAELTKALREEKAAAATAEEQRQIVAAELAEVKEDGSTATIAAAEQAETAAQALAAETMRNASLVEMAAEQAETAAQALAAEAMRNAKLTEMAAEQAETAAQALAAEAMRSASLVEMAAEQAETAAQALAAEAMRNAKLTEMAAARLEEASSAKFAAAAAESDASEHAADQTQKQQHEKMAALEGFVAAANAAAAKSHERQIECKALVQEAKREATDLAAALEIQQQAATMKGAANDELELRIASQHVHLKQADEISDALRKQFAITADTTASKFEELASKHVKDLASAKKEGRKSESEAESLKIQAAEQTRTHTLLTEELASARRELQMQIVAVAVRDAKIVEAETNAGRLTEGLESMRAACAEHQDDGRQLAFELQTVQGQLATTKSEIAALQGAFETATTNASTTAATLAETTRSLASVTTELKHAKAEFETSQANLARSIVQVEGLDIVVARESAHMDQVALDLRSRSEELQQSTLALEFSKNKLSVALEKEELLAANLKAAHAGSADQQHEITKLADEWTNTKLELGKMQAELAVMRTQCAAELAEERANAAAELSEERANAATVLAEVEAFSAVELKEVQAIAAGELAEVREKLVAELAEERAKLLAANDSAADLNATIATLEMKLAAAEAALAQFKGLIIKANKDVARMTATLDESRKELLALRATDAYAALGNMTSLYKREAQQRKYLHNKLRELKGNIQVFCRIRPDPNANLAKEVVKCADFNHKVPMQVSAPYVGYLKQSHKYEFDRVFAAGKHPISQEDVFKDSTEPIITAVLDGYNVAVIAYGQTGTGKTHTMMGTPEDPGVTFRSVNHLLVNCKANKNVEYKITVGLLEVYLDKLVDLLSGNPVEEQSCTIKAGHVEGLTRREVNTTDEVLAIMAEGGSNRKVASTAMNSESSRSHLVVFISVDGYDTVSLMSTSAKLTLVDLAGSERIDKSSGASKLSVATKLAETVSINKSLTCLGQVFSSIHEGAKHVPYRNSKLTHVLQEVLTADTKVCIFVHVSSNEANLGESISTMKFGKTIGSIEQNRLQRIQKGGSIAK